MDIKLLDIATQDALTERMKPRLCSIDDASGNIFEFKNRLFIITCKHVADSFFNQNSAYIVLRDNSRIYSKNLVYRAYTKDRHDIALIEILDFPKIEKCFNLLDIQIVEDFDIEEKKSFYFIFGFPTQLNFSKDGKGYIPYMSYLTVKSRIKKSDEEFLYLEYDRNSEKNLVYESQLKTILPNPHGLSGAFIYKIEEFENKEIWDPSYAKVVAIQTDWEPKKGYLKGANIKYLVNILETII